MFNGDVFHKHCLTGISKLEMFDEIAYGMSTDNKLVLLDVTGLSTDNLPRGLTTCFKEVLHNGVTIHAEPYGEPASGPSPWTEQHKVGGGVIRPYNYIIRPLPSTYDQKLSLLSRLFPKTKAGIKCLDERMTVYFSFNVYQSSHGIFSFQMFSIRL